MRMASGHHQQDAPHGGVLSGNGSPALWGALLGLIIFAFVAVPISAAVRFATHPATQQLFGGQVPADRDTLQTLPGVGRKTANVVMNVAFGAETFAVDTHVFRVSNRTGLAPGKNELEVEKKLDRLTPPPFRRQAHHLLILHGRYVCKARKPECWRCVVSDLCAYKPKTPAPQGRAE